MINYELLHLLESELGSSEHKKDGNYAFKCPKCSSKYGDHKKKLEVDLNTTKTLKNYFHCWRCEFKGITIENLFKQLKSDKSVYRELAKHIKYDRTNFTEKEKTDLVLPAEYVPLYNFDKMDYFQKIQAKETMKYLKSRNVSEVDIVKHNIGICNSGKYQNRIILPSYNMFNELNMFVARWGSDDVPKNVFPYLKPEVNESEIIPFENMINFSMPILLCEGYFDAMALKINSIPLLGKTISDKLKNALLSSDVNDIYICLDDDAKKKALQYVELFWKQKKRVYFVELNGKDPSKLGYDLSWDAVRGCKQAEFKDILHHRIRSFI